MIVTETHQLKIASSQSFAIMLLHSIIILVLTMMNNLHSKKNNVGTVDSNKAVSE